MAHDIDRILEIHSISGTLSCSPPDDLASHDLRDLNDPFNLEI